MEERKWYVLHALSGQENKALDNLKKRIVFFPLARKGTAISRLPAMRRGAFTP